MAFKVGSNAIDTDDVAEGSNQYYTNARADGRITAADTDALSEGSSNLYYTNARAQSVSINNVSEDSTPQLGGALDVNGNNISSTSNNNVVIDPNGNGLIQLNASTTIQDGSHNFDVASHDGTNGLLLGGTLVTSSATEINKLDGYTGGATDLQKIADYTGTASELNVLDLNANEIVGVFKVATSVPSSASDFTGNVKIIMVY